MKLYKTNLVSLAIVVTRERVESSKLHPSLAQILIDVTIKSADVSTNLQERKSKGG